MNIGLRRTTSTCLLGLLFLLSGCATTRNLSEVDRNRISVVRINSNVQKAPVMYYQGTGTGLRFAAGAIGGSVAAVSSVQTAHTNYLGPGTGFLLAAAVIGGAVAEASSVETGKALQDFAEKNDIFIERIAFQEIDAALRQSGKIKVSDTAEASEATMNVLVYLYGYSIPNGFSSKLVPVVAISCEMVDATGKVIWRASDNVQILRNPSAPMSLEAMRANPRLIEDGWRRAARRIAGNIARAL